MKKTSFYLLTDTHFVSKKIWTEGKPFTMREKGDQIALKASPEILDTFIEKIIADKEADTVIFTGDNVNNGDMPSHYDFRERLELLVSAGKKVYVTTATHDYCGEGDDENFFHACRYTETGTQPVECMRKSGLFDFYYDYGPKQAISVHRESGSYTVQLGEGVRLAAINDNGNGRSHCGLFEDGVRWLTEQIHDAKANNDFILLAVHHPVISPWEVYRHMADFELYGGYRDLWKLMCEENVRVVFTGHTHLQNIRKYTDESGRWFLDVSTIALVNAAGKMRRVTVDPDEGMCDVKSVGIEKINGVDTGDKTVFEYLYELNLPGLAEPLIRSGATDFDKFLSLAEGILPVEKLKKHKIAVRYACRKLLNLKLSSVAKFGRSFGKMSDEQKEKAKKARAADALFEVLRHIYPGNAPFTPDTAEYIAVDGAAKRLDGIVNRFHISKVQQIIPPGSSLREMSQDFLYNNRTGDDDAIRFSLK